MDNKVNAYASISGTMECANCSNELEVSDLDYDSDSRESVEQIVEIALEELATEEWQLRDESFYCPDCYSSGGIELLQALVLLLTTTDIKTKITELDQAESTNDGEKLAPVITMYKTLIAITEAIINDN